jgi:hypothetical protein
MSQTGKNDDRSLHCVETRDEGEGERRAARLQLPPKKRH